MRELTTAAKAAKLIKKELKLAMPAIKFGVRSSNFAGGDSVHIWWIDGPTKQDVQSIVGKYQYGHFDGMDDSYKHSNVNENIPQVMFVQTTRYK